LIGGTGAHRYGAEDWQQLTASADAHRAHGMRWLVATAPVRRRHRRCLAVMAAKGESGPTRSSTRTAGAGTCRDLAAADVIQAPTTPPP
jgi:hypothetical protein